MQHAVTLVAALAALLWDGAGASPHASAFRRRDVPQIPGYDFSGCYTEATNSRALTGSAYFDDLMTVEKCAAACSGFKYFGVEYGRECYCGNTIAEGSVQASLADCSFACPGDATQNCGAGNRLDLFTRTTDPAPLTELGYLSRGCYAEPAGGRALTSQATRADDMTVEACATFCGNAGYALFGLEYYTECYCGNVLMPGAEPAADADCKYPCAGNANELCGGDWRLNLYEFGSSPTSTASTASSTPSVGPATYTSEGCYTEATGIRALSDVAYFDDAMTVEKCAAACAGYAWFGLEYGRECYGGNAINSAQGSVPTSLSECSFPCPGNPSQKCGAGDRLNMY
ncbi:WSC-domain-containing protein, partial [Parathielavia appendiculata]